MEKKGGQEQNVQGGKKKRGRLVKKWSKKSLCGDIMSTRRYIQCLKLGIDAHPFLLYGNIPSRPGICIELPACLPASQLRDLIFCTMLPCGPDDLSLIASRRGDRRSSPRLRIANVACMRGIVVMAFTGLPIPLSDNGPSSPEPSQHHPAIYKGDGEEESVSERDDANNILLSGLSRSFIDKFQYRSKLGVSGGKRTPSITEMLLYYTRGEMMVGQQRHHHRPKKRPREEETEGEGTWTNKYSQQSPPHRKMMMISDEFPGIQHYIMSPKDLRHHGYPFAPESYLLTLAPPTPDSANTGYRDRLLKSNSSLPMLLPSFEEACTFISGCVPEVPGLEGYVCTLPLPSSPILKEIHDDGLNTPKIFALDCEMCEVEGGRSELIRISIINDESQVVIDTLVVPFEPVTDYRTQWSGITADMLVGVSTRLHQVQAAILHTICDKDILVGHSLDNDLKALRLCHRRCVDTSVLYPHPQNGRKSSLRHLAKLYLKRDIQSDKEGHCSVQDAMTALDLVQLKVHNGPEFGAEGERVSLLEKFTECGKRCTFAGEAAACAAHGTAGSTSAIVLRGKRGEFARVAHKECSPGGTLALTHQFAAATAAAVVSDDNDDIIQRINSPPGALWLQMPEKPSSSPSLQEVARGDLRKLYKGKSLLHHYMKELEIEASLVLDALPNDVLVVMALQCEEKLPKEMLQWKKRCMSGGGANMMASVWSNSQEELLQHLLNATQIGYVLLSVSR